MEAFHQSSSGPPLRARAAGERAIAGARRAAAKKRRKAAAKKKRVEARAKLAAHLEAERSRVWRCGELVEMGGTPGCDCVRQSEAAFLRHVEVGKKRSGVHRCGLVRTYAAGPVAGTLSARDARLTAIAAQSSTITRHGGEGGAAVPTLGPVEALQCEMCDGSTWQPPPPEVGFAAEAQGGTTQRRRSAQQLRFVRMLAHSTKEATPKYDNPHGQEAAQLMEEWGTAGFASRYARLHEARAAADAPNARLLPPYLCSGRDGYERSGICRTISSREARYAYASVREALGCSRRAPRRRRR